MLRRALRISWQGRPGVVHVCIPEDVLNGEFDDPGPGRPGARRATGGRRRSRPDPIDGAVTPPTCSWPPSSR